MDKRTIIREIQTGLANELQSIVESAKAAHDAATNAESRAEDQHDTRGVEASYLAGAQAARVAEIHRLITVFKFFPIRDFTEKDLIGPGALVELELNNTRAFYFIVPQGGGLVVRVDGNAVQVITPQSPIGDALMARKVGDTIEIDSRAGTRKYKVISVG